MHSMGPAAFGFIVVAFAAARPAVVTGQATSRVNKIEAITVKQGVAKLKELIDQAAPGGLTPAEQQQYKEQTEWLTSAHSRLSVLTAREAASGMATGRQAAPVTESAQKLTELQQALQMESRKFQTLSNASKARHDMAMSIIRNMKA